MDNTAMNLGIALVVAILGGLGGLVLAGFITSVCVRWYRIPAREGQSGYFVVFTSLGGGFASLIISFITALVVAANFGPDFAGELGGVVVVLLVIAGVITVNCRLRAHLPPTIDGQELNLEVEFRFPVGNAGAKQSTSAPTTESQWWVEFDPLVSRNPHRQRASGEILNAAARLEEGRWIVPTRTHLFTSRGKRFVRLFNDSLEEKDGAGFILPVPAQPGKVSETWSGWFPERQPDGQPWLADKMSCRYRVQFVPPPKTQAEREAEEATRKETVFAALPVDAPLSDWLPYVQYPQPQTERALQAIAKRPNVVREIEELALGDGGYANVAVKCISELPGPTAQFNASMQRVGLDIAERIRKVNAIPAGQDPHDIAGSEVSSRFMYWHTAITTLREKSGGDFTPELKTILEVSRVKKDSVRIQIDICRVTSYYLHAWAGVEPLPTDPKPR